MFINFIFICSNVLLYGLALGLLYPKDSLTRETKSLNGLWKFAINEKVSRTGYLSLHKYVQFYRELKMYHLICHLCLCHQVIMMS